MIETREDIKQNLNTFRPYYKGMIEHDYDLASIVLFKKRNKLPESPTNNNSGSGGDGNIKTGTSNSDYTGYNTDMVPGISRALAGSVVDKGNSVISLDDNEIPTLRLSEDEDYFGVFNNFCLINAVEQRDEIVKVNQNFGGGWNAFFFGERARVYSFSGMFLDSKDYPYYQEFMTAYERYLSGRKCIENGFTLTMSYDGKIIKGHILKISTGTTAEAVLRKTFEFNVLVESDAWYRSNIRDNGFEGVNSLSNRRRYEQLAIAKEQKNTGIAEVVEDPGFANV